MSLIDQRLEQTPSPIQLIEHPNLKAKGIELSFKRDDCLRLESTPGNWAFCGNKWRKLKYNLQAAFEADTDSLLTFGGAFSNHIAAVASAGKLFGYNTIGIIRGEAQTKLNPTLRKAVACGMKLHYLDRSTYRLKNSPAIIQQLQKKYGDFYLIPEGGSNAAALKGCAELGKEIITQSQDALPDYICLPCGTGGTMAGLIMGIEDQCHIIGFSALKGDFLTQEVDQFLKSRPNQNLKNWQINTDFHFGGFAKFKTELIDFMNIFKTDQNIQLDPLYTGKMTYGIFEMITAGKFKPGSKILAIHTGGLQGLEGFQSRFGTLLK